MTTEGIVIAEREGHGMTLRIIRPVACPPGCDCGKDDSGLIVLGTPESDCWFVVGQITPTPDPQSWTPDDTDKLFAAQDNDFIRRIVRLFGINWRELEGEGRNLWAGWQVNFLLYLPPIIAALVSILEDEKLDDYREQMVAWTKREGEAREKLNSIMRDAPMN